MRPLLQHSLQILAVVALLGLLELALWQVQQARQSRDMQQLAHRSAQLCALLEAELNSVLYLTIGLVSWVTSLEGRLDQSQLDAWMANLIGGSRHVRNIGIAPGNRLQYLYPLAGNEGALGLYYPDVPSQWPDIERLIRENRPTLSGPVPLKQGGSGLIYRVPVIVQGRYWGLVSTVMNAGGLQSMLEEAAERLEVVVAVRQLPVSPSGADARSAANSIPAPFWGQEPPLSRPVYVQTLTLPNVTWELLVMPSQLPVSSWRWRLSGWLVLMVLVWLGWLWQRQRALQRRARAAHQAQQAFNSAIVDRVVDGLLTFDGRCRVVSGNVSAGRLLGMAADRLVGVDLRGWLDFPGLPGGTGCGWMEALAEGSTVTGRLCAPHREPIEIEAVATRLVGIPQAKWLLVLRDISERTRNERLKNEFVSTVSHELRTPLTSISGALALISGQALGEVPAPMRGMLEIARSNTERLSSLINDLLDIEKLLAGQMRFDLQSVELAGLLRRAVHDNEGYGKQYGVALVLMPGDVGRVARVRVDPGRFLQIMANLLSNAIKFSPAGESVRNACEERDSFWRVQVEDRGPGIPDSFRERIFQKFSQADSSDTRQKGGTGLGLAITRALVEQMGGRIGFDSVVGQGTRFFVEFPALPPA